MIKIFSVIPEELVQPLEDYFCEEISSWSIVHPRPEDAVTLCGYFDDETESRSRWDSLRNEFPTLPRDPEVEVVQDEDWMESYKHHLRPWAYGRLQWVPEWERESFAVERDQAVVYLDSGLAFGTGSHETTRLCAEALVEYSEAKGVEGKVIDAGCGSGVLALSAIKLGFAEVFAFDNDPEAIRVTKENATANGLDDDLMVAEAGIEDGLAKRKCTLLLANIQSNVLSVYADEFTSSVQDGGWLVLSGILAHEAERVASVFQGAAERNWGEKIESIVRTDGEWSLVLFERSG
ncbi:MAG: 50S ribosomal protein L11 methyltransferase [Verrucomicrobiota bacterium]